MLESVRFSLKTRYLITLLLLSTVLFIQYFQLVPLSSGSLLKAPKLTNPLDSMAARTSSLTTTSTSNQSIGPNWPDWRTQIAKIQVPRTGCFSASYPSTVWQPTQCATAPLIPLRPSPLTVGNGLDEVAQAPSGKFIGSSIGSFQVSGLTSETDSLYGANNYGLQVNSQTFPTNTAYTGGKSTTGWEQFVWINWPYYNSVGLGYIQYWLLGYYSVYGNCPSTGPPLGSSWMVYLGDCYANSLGVTTPLEAPTNLASLSLAGFSNYNGGGVDIDMFCISGGSCYSVSITDQIVNLYLNWQYSESNVFGVGSASQANFNSGTTITVTNTLKDQSTNVIVPSCVNTGYTGETNNLNLGPCSSNSNGQIVFTENIAPTTATATVTQTTTQTTPLYSYVATSTVTSYTATSISTSTVPIVMTVVLVPVTSTVQTTQSQTSVVTMTVTSYTSTSTSISIIPTVVTVVLVPVTSTVQTTQSQTSFTTVTVTNYASTAVSTSTVPVITTIVLVPVTSTVQGTQSITSLTTATVTNYASTFVSTSTILTTVTVGPPTTTIQTTQIATSTVTVTVTGISTATVTSYTATQTSTSTVVVPTTVTISPTLTSQTTQVVTGTGTVTVSGVTTATVTSYTGTKTLTSTIVVGTTVTVSPSTSLAYSTTVTTSTGFLGEPILSLLGALGLAVWFWTEARKGTGASKMLLELRRRWLRS